MPEKQLRPIKRFILLLDDERETMHEGVIVKRGECSFGMNLDYMVLKVGTNERCGFGQGDRVILSSPDAGRKLKLDGVPMRLVRVEDIIGVME